jgi:hypothetical protein
MCKAADKEWSNYHKATSTKEFLDELSRSLQIGRDLLIRMVSTGRNELRGTWVHPQVATHLGQWLSPKFAVKVSKWVLDWMSGNRPQYTMPYHLRRYLANTKNVPRDHFSVLQEMDIVLVAPLEQQGYLIPSEIIPDISEGLMFANWLKAQGVDTGKMPTYPHKYEDGRVVAAKMYPLEYLPAFREHVLKVWLPKKAREYFAARDHRALPYLDKILQDNATIAARPFSRLPLLNQDLLGSMMIN